MGIRCKMAGHSPQEPGVFNAGLHFTRCSGCGAELIRQQGGRWLPVPQEFRIRWERDGQHSIAPWKAINIAHRKRWRL
jgi:hypothetical protein